MAAEITTTAPAVVHQPKFTTVALGKSDGRLQRIIAIAQQSQQDPLTRKLTGSLFSSAKIVEPAYDPATLYTIYNSNSDINAAVDALVDTVVGGGFVIKQADTVDALGGSAASDVTPNPNPDRTQLERLKKFLEAPNSELDEDFVGINRDILRDVIVTGQGYIEFGRELGTQYINQAWYAPSVALRVAEDRQTLYYLSGRAAKAFRKLGSPEIGVTQTLKAKANSDEASVEFVLAHRQKGSAEYKSGVAPIALSGSTKVGDLEIKLQADESLTVRSLNEIAMLKRRDPLNAYYGRPWLLGALLDHTVTQSILKYNQAFFDNNTVPPLAIIVKGDELGEDGVKYVSEVVGRQSGNTSATHKTLVIEVDSETSVDLQPLESARQSEGYFIQLLEKSAKRTFAVMRVPYSYVYQDEASAEGTLKGAVTIFMSSVVQPLREWLAHFWNRVIKEYMGITDWIVELAAVQSEDIETRAKVWTELLLRGVLNINEIRQELGLRPIEGGSDNFITIQGTGVVVINLLKLFSERAAEGKSRSDLLPSGGAKTPANEPMPVLTPSKGAANG